MGSFVSTDTTRKGKQEAHFGIPPSRMVFLALISLLAVAFELFLLLTIRSVHLLPGLTIFTRVLSFFHLLPWLAGLACWGKVKRALGRGEIGATGADLCYSTIIALLSATYAVLASFELALVLPWIVNR